LEQKSYMRKGFLIYEEMRKHFTVYEEAASFWISLSMRKIFFSFLSVHIIYIQYVVKTFQSKDQCCNQHIYIDANNHIDL
jgi:hypothetical protein